MIFTLNTNAMKLLSKPIILILFLLFILFRTAFAQSANDLSKPIAPELLQQDFTSLHDTLQKIHAGLYRYKSKAEVDRLFDRCFKKLDHPMTEVAYFAIISRLISGIEDGHTECFLPKDFINQFITQVKLFPIQPRFIGEKAYVPCDTKEFPAGTELLAIDHRSIGTIRKRLFEHLSSDGGIQTEKYVKVNDGHDPFAYLYDVVYGTQENFEVKYKTVGGTTAVKTIAGDYLKNMECPSPGRVIPNRYLELAYQPGNIAVMTIRTFANEYLVQTKENLTDFLAASFKELENKKIGRLIIDLRENGGGNDSNGALLYSYLTDHPFAYYASLSSTTKAIKDHPDLVELQQPHKGNYKGKVVFLTSGKSFSGAAEFSSIARTNNRGAFVGEETGGGYYGNTSGNKITFFLPNTQIKVNIPLFKYVMAVRKAKYKDRGTIPDYLIVPTMNDIIQHHDIQMDFALQLAAK
ncbi:S41 family peptidase [Mucilaginibacter sp. OK098]|uniref:S41 family peptidase n=1 Tax=Mucilaginibacter sp. OK098 TaxID=1855297 RepID=UPI0009F9C937|nr:S41 family peptidase [Mucilaginibacter sp. OK098]